VSVDSATPPYPQVPVTCPYPEPTPYSPHDPLQEVGGGRGDWMELAQDRDRWRELVGRVRDFRVP